MEEELLSVVDENDRVVGYRERGEVHRLGLRHRAVHVLVFNHRGELFLQKRAMSKPENPGLWDSSAAGHVDHGEDYDACVVREVEEELGVLLTDTPQALFRIDSSPMTGMEFIKVYRAAHDGPFELNRDEIDDGRWIEPKALDTWIGEGAEGLTPPLVYIWQHVRNAE
ncbi:MAG: NUDIX domain-containing protein [Pseudomonadota bacterium]|nr:NUDIX domain-containing protein [Pseudomonadota bacterium]